MSFSINDGPEPFRKIRRAAFLVEDEDGRVMVYGFDTDREIVVETEIEYDLNDLSVPFQEVYQETRLTISGISGDPFQHSGPFPAASTEEIKDTEKKLLAELNRKAIGS